MTGELLQGVSALVRELADMQSEYAAARDGLAAAQKAVLVTAGRVGALHSKLAALLNPGACVTVKVAAQEAITVVMPDANSRAMPVCTRSRIVA